MLGAGRTTSAATIKQAKPRRKRMIVQKFMGALARKLGNSLEKRKLRMLPSRVAASFHGMRRILEPMRRSTHTRCGADFEQPGKAKNS